MGFFSAEDYIKVNGIPALDSGIDVFNSYGLIDLELNRLAGGGTQIGNDPESVISKEIIQLDRSGIDVATDGAKKMEMEKKSMGVMNNSYAGLAIGGILLFLMIKK